MELLFLVQFQASITSWSKQNDLGTLSGFPSNKMNELRIILHTFPWDQASRSPGDRQLMGSSSAAGMAPVHASLTTPPRSLHLRFFFLLEKPNARELVSRLTYPTNDQWELMEK